MDVDAMRTSPLASGESLPALTLFRPDGTGLDVPGVLEHGPVVMYFMRTPTCPVCNAHLRQMKRSAEQSLMHRLLVIVPGGPVDADLVSKRHPELADRIASSEDAHAAVGLFVRAGLQQSGTFVVDSAGTVLVARTSTIPLGAYDEGEVLDALGLKPETGVRIG
ncbi:hypothetical protein ABZ477_17765 [Microbacterium sp. NPDC019599]|uniref:hypothetical protein n=1 Tax=Microbacterium sp. NPDC019599 TaxID=3154690 RepID=UPI0033E86C76